MKDWYPYLSKKSKRFFVFWTALNAFFLIGGIVMMCFGMASGCYGFILLISYVPFYFSNVDLGEARKRSHDMGLPPIENYKTMK